MRIRHAVLVLPLLLATACSKGDHPLKGYWKAEGELHGLRKVGVELDGGSDRALAHVDTAAGEHLHKQGTYTFDAATNAVTIRCLLMGDGKADTWTGTVAGDTMSLEAGGVKLALKRGGSAH